MALACGGSVVHRARSHATAPTRTSLSLSLCLADQVVENGGSCTGTALTMLAAYRAVGIPARIAGCSNEYKNGAEVGGVGVGVLGGGRASHGVCPTAKRSEQMDHTSDDEAPRRSL